MLYALARHPEVQRRLREEVLSVVGPTAIPTSKQLQELHYAKSIITETLRCVCAHVVCVHVGVCMWCVCMWVCACGVCRGLCEVFSICTHVW